MFLDNELVRPLSLEEEIRLLKEWKLTGDKKIQDRFVMSVYKLCVREAVRCSNIVPLEDRIQAGVIGATRAFQKFKASKKHRFNTYALFWVRAEIWQLVGDNRTIVSGTKIRGGKAHQAKDDARRAVLVESLDSYKDDEGHYLHSSKRVDEDSEDADQRAEMLHDLMDRAGLTSEEKLVIRLRWLDKSGERIPLKKVADKLKVSGELVRLIEKDAFDKIRYVKVGDEE